MFFLHKSVSRCDDFSTPIYIHTYIIMIEDVLKKLKYAKETNGTIEDIPEELYCELFWEFVDGDGLQDDLLFFVSTNSKTSESEPQIQVCRHVPKQRPALEIKVNWSATLILNLICQINFRLRICSCRYEEGEISGMFRLVVKESTNKQVYASPLETLFDRSWKKKEINSPIFSFPNIYFCAQNNASENEFFFDNLNLGPEDILIVELYSPLDAIDRKEPNYIGIDNFYKKIETNCIFQGAISNRILNLAYQKNSIELETSHGTLIIMSGPEGIGEAQVHATGLNENNNFINSISSSSSSPFKSLKKIKQFFSGFGFIGGRSTALKIANITNHPTEYKCKLNFIRLHWKDLIESFLK